MSLPAPKSRNDPCPCGSGKRYKYCHGSDAPPEAAVAVAASQDPVEVARAELRNGRLSEAAAVIERAFGPEPGHLAALKLYAEALRPADPARSLACWERAHAMAPGDPEPMFFLADFAREAGDFARAIALFELALAGAPDHPALLNNLGLAQEKAGDLAAAERSFQRVLETSPDDLNALANLAQNYYQQKRFRESIPLFERVVKAMPDAPAAIWANFGATLRYAQSYGRAEACLVRATEIAPDLPEPWRDLGACRMAAKQWGSATLAFSRAVELDPEDHVSKSYLIHTAGHECVWDRFDELRADVIDAARKPGYAKGMLPSPYTLQSISDDPDLEKSVVHRWTQLEFLPVVNERPPRRAHRDRLRLGFVSPDFHGHPVGRLIVGVLERLDKSRFEVFGYDTMPQPTHPIWKRIQAACERFHMLPESDARDVAALVRADEVDVLFDLTGHTAGSNLSVFSLRPAPMQVNYLGYPGTSGCRAMDWILTDPYCIPDERADTCLERLLHVEPCYMPPCGDEIDASIAVAREDYKLPASATVFAVMSSAYKIMPERFDAWMEILRGVPDSVLWIRYMSGVATRRLHLRADAAGVDPDRVLIVKNEPTSRYLARYRLADLFLDTWPYGSHTTVNDALSAGLPVLTEAGRSFASRASASQVVAAGLPELVTTSLDDYVATAVELGRHPAQLRELAERLRAARRVRPYFDLDGFTRRFEAAVERAWAETPDA